MCITKDKIHTIILKERARACSFHDDHTHPLHHDTYKYYINYYIFLKLHIRYLK